MESSAYQTLKLDRDGTVLTATLNRPEVMNAANALLEIELCRFFTEVSHDPMVRVVVLTGEGKAFCAGGEMSYITEMLDHPERFLEAMNYGRRLVFAMLECTKPVIAKINGHAVGLGATLALFCDISFAAEHAKIADPHVCLGFVAGDGGAVIWPQLIGANRAKEYLFTPAGPALAGGGPRNGWAWINHAVPAAELDQRGARVRCKKLPPCRRSRCNGPRPRSTSVCASWRTRSWTPRWPTRDCQT